MWLTHTTPAGLADFMAGWETATNCNILHDEALSSEDARGITRFNELNEAIDALIKYIERNSDANNSVKR